MRRLTRCGVVSVLALAASGALLGAQQQQPSIFTPGSTIPVLESYLESLRAQAGIPGMSGAIVRDGEIAWERGFGYANLNSHVRTAPDTPYVVGDLTGTLAAVLALQCVEQRHLALDDPIERYGLSSPEPSATLRGLLSHNPPGSTRDAFQYSPERFAHVTELVEACAPQPYRKSVAHRILEHLAMQDSAPGTDWKDPGLSLPDGLFTDEDRDHYRAVLDRLAVPYKVTNRTRTDVTTVPTSGINAAAGLVSTVRDLAKFDAALDQGDNGGLLLADTLGAAWTPAVGASGTPSPMGLGWFVQTYKGERVVWHFGNVPNAYSALIVKLPARGITFILLANSDGLTAPFDLTQGDVTRSLFASLFLRLVI
ncbi:MAG TPA: serine hydrolase domain-containing protein [Vicinamibacterales bacterium]|jgi:CubicO group peptidase (beta-lactamase class C family)